MRQAHLHQAHLHQAHLHQAHLSSPANLSVGDDKWEEPVTLASGFFERL